MATFRDSRGRFSSRPRDSAGRYRSVEWYNRSQGQKARYSAQSEARAAESYSRRRAAEIAAEYEAAAKRYESESVAGPDLHEQQDAWDILEIGRQQIQPGAPVKIHVEMSGKTIYEYDGPASDFAPMELRQALDEWSEQDMDDDSHYWRAPELRLWDVERWLDVNNVVTRIDVKPVPDAMALLKTAISGGAQLPGYKMDVPGPAPVDWPEEDDALPV